MYASALAEALRITPAKRADGSCQDLPQLPENELVGAPRQVKRAG